MLRRVFCKTAPVNICFLIGMFSLLLYVITDTYFFLLPVSITAVCPLLFWCFILISFQTRILGSSTPWPILHPTLVRFIPRKPLVSGQCNPQRWQTASNHLIIFSLLYLLQHCLLGLFLNAPCKILLSEEFCMAKKDQSLTRLRIFISCLEI